MRQVRPLLRESRYGVSIWWGVPGENDLRALPGAGDDGLHLMIGNSFDKKRSRGHNWSYLC